jgi:hypothetical protein
MVNCLSQGSGLIVFPPFLLLPTPPAKRSRPKAAWQWVSYYDILGDGAISSMHMGFVGQAPSADLGLPMGRKVASAWGYGARPIKPFSLLRRCAAQWGQVHSRSDSLVPLRRIDGTASSLDHLSLIVTHSSGLSLMLLLWPMVRAAVHTWVILFSFSAVTMLGKSPIAVTLTT